MFLNSAGPGVGSTLWVIMGCDANSHHTVWESSDVNARRQALTFFISVRQEVIDITVATMNVACDVQEWHVLTALSASDHRFIRFYKYFQKDAVLNAHYKDPKATDWVSNNKEWSLI